MQIPDLNHDPPPQTGARKLMQACTPFAVACASGMVATICIQPIDTLKVRMQLTDQSDRARSSLSLARSIVGRDGLPSLYQGLSAGLLRQLVYGTMRLGLFTTFENHLEERARAQRRSTGFSERALAGITAGALAAFIGTPTEVALVQIQADGMRPLHKRMNYSSAFDALRRIAKHEGFLGLWKGATPTIVRAMSTNFGQLAFFSESKHQIQKYTSMSREQRTALAAFIAGFAGAFISLPFDFIKTRLQNQAISGPSSSGLPIYKGVWHCLTTVVRKEGPLRFYRDFWPYFMRIAPHSYVLGSRLKKATNGSLTQHDCSFPGRSNACLYCKKYFTHRRRAVAPCADDAGTHRCGWRKDIICKQAQQTVLDLAGLSPGVIEHRFQERRLFNKNLVFVHGNRSNFGNKTLTP